MATPAKGPSSAKGSSSSQPLDSNYLASRENELEKTIARLAKMRIDVEKLPDHRSDKAKRLKGITASIEDLGTQLNGVKILLESVNNQSQPKQPVISCPKAKKQDVQTQPTTKILSQKPASSSVGQKPLAQPALESKEPSK